MNEELEKKFYFLRNFVIEDYVNLRIEKIIACEELNTKNIVFVYLKVIGKNIFLMQEQVFGKTLKLPIITN